MYTKDPYTQSRTISKIKPVESTLQKITVSTFVYQLALILFCIERCINISELAQISYLSSASQVMTYCVMGLLVLKILLFARYSIREIIIYLIFTVVAILGAYNYGNRELIYLVLFIIGAKEVNIRTICRTTLTVIVICGITIILLSLMGLIGNKTTYTSNGISGEVVTRRAFGFNHVNQLGQLSLIAFICFLYLRYKSFGVLEICITLIWSALLYFGITSKTAPLLMLFACILIVLSKVMSYKWFIAVCAIIGAIGILSALLLAYFYDPTNEFMGQINTWVSGRLNYAHRTFEEYSITLFGQSIEFGEAGTSGRIILDNAYVRLLFCYGIIPFIAVITAYIYGFVKACKKHMLSIVIIMTLMLLVGFSETWFFTLPGVIALSIAFGKSNRDNMTLNTSEYS